MKINIGNIKGMNNAIGQVQSLSKVRTVDSIEVQKEIKNLENILENKGLLKKDWLGLKFNVNPNNQPFPKAYKFTPEATIVTIERFPSGWFMTDVKRSFCGTRKYVMVSNLNDSQKKSLVENFKNFG